MNKRLKTGLMATALVATGAMGVALVGTSEVPCSTDVHNYAQLNEKDIVKNIIVADECFILSGAVGDPTMWVITDYSIPEKSAAIDGKYDKTAGEFITKEDVKKYGGTVKVKDIIKLPKDPEVSTSTIPK